MTLKERELRQKIQCGIMEIILNNTNNDKEFYEALLFALEQITNELKKF